MTQLIGNKPVETDTELKRSLNSAYLRMIAKRTDFCIGRAIFYVISSIVLTAKWTSVMQPYSLIAVNCLYRIPAATALQIISYLKTYV